MAARASVDLGLHQDPPSEVLPAEEQLDMRRRVFHCVYCMDSRRLVDILQQNFELVLSPSVPVLPSVFHDITKPPMLEACNTVNCHGRAIECLDHIQKLLQFGAVKWELNNLLEGFQQDSASVWKQLMDTPVAYLPGPGAYMAGPCAILPGAGTVYSDLTLGHYNPNAP
ncbi:hypothetical protein APSETT444_010197 [Aspergillus pseudonomiae]